MKGVINQNEKSWVKGSNESGFPIQNLPLGICSITGGTLRMCTRIGDWVIDLKALFEAGLIKATGITLEVLENKYLNDYMELGKEVHHGFREELSALLKEGNTTLFGNEPVWKAAFYPHNQVEMHLPVQVRDYTDFYSSREHATNVGTMFRDPKNALLPNWLHLPVGYHGRASSIIASGVPFHRPKGQTKPSEDAPPVFGPSRLLDFELEMAFVIGTASKLGHNVPTSDGEKHIFGLSIFNDWSARDIQKWEYVPLGPFLGKNFASTLSPWITPLEALEPFKIDGPIQNDPQILPYLEYEGQHNYDITLEVYLKPEGGEENLISKSNYKYMYWNMVQQLAHHTINGCNINVGDLYASGTISGTEPESYGSMLELSWKGTKPLKLSDGSERKFLKDGDTLIMRGYGQKGDLRINMGEISTKILPAI